MRDTTQKLTDVERGYLAGVLDSEAWVGVTRQKCNHVKAGIRYQAKIAVANTSYDYVINIQLLVGSGGVRQDRSYLRSLGNHKPTWIWTISSTAICAIIPQVLDLLVVKRKQAILLLEQIKIGRCNRGSAKASKENMKRTEEIYQELRKLNQRGKSQEIFNHTIPIEGD